jgi:hypothetical protein
MNGLGDCSPGLQTTKTYMSMRNRTMRELCLQKKRMFELHCDLVLRDYGYLDNRNQNQHPRMLLINHICNEYYMQMIERS